MNTIRTLHKMKARGEKIAMLTCYDASFAHLLDQAGLDCILVGDSLGMVIQGRRSTLGVSLQDMVYHTRAVARGNTNMLIVVDLPFASFECDPQQAFRSAAELMCAGAQMVKIEGGSDLAHTVEFLSGRGIPVCAHIGLTPQSVNIFGGYTIQGRDESGAARLLQAAKDLNNAGCALLVMECVPAALAADITAASLCPTIGIGAGVGCDGQVLVLYDMLGMGKAPSFVHNFLSEADSIDAAVRAYINAVRQSRFPSAEHSF